MFSSIVPFLPKKNVKSFCSAKSPHIFSAKLVLSLCTISTEVYRFFETSNITSFEQGSHEYNHCSYSHTI